MLDCVNWQLGETLALQLLCLLTSGAAVNSVSGVSTQEASEQTGYQGTLIGFANSWAGCCSPGTDTCSHTQESNFRLLYLKIPANNDPNCTGNKWHRFAQWLQFPFFCRKNAIFKTEWRTLLVIGLNPGFEAHKLQTQIPDQHLCSFTAHWLCRCNHYNVY